MNRERDAVDEMKDALARAERERDEARGFAADLERILLNEGGVESAAVRQVAAALRERNEARESAIAAAAQSSESSTMAAVHHPAHYTAGKVECIDALESAVMGLEGPAAALTWTAMKYLWRWSKKNGVEDLEKARWYIDRLIAHLRKER